MALINTQIRYQIRLGKHHLELFMKNHHDHHWKPFRKMDIKVIDPNDEIPKWDLSVSSGRSIFNATSPYDITKNPGKRGAVESPEGRISKRSNIDDWQICEFVWAFLEGTKTEPNYQNLTWENEERQPEEVEENAATENHESGVVSEADETHEAED